jgi:transcriptional regulator with XRE-family HTH domain
MNNLKRELTKLTSDQISDGKTEGQCHCENKEWQKKSAAIAIFILEGLKAQNLSQKDLAEKLNVSSQQISKILKGQENLTLETITNLEKALGIRITISTLSTESLFSMMIREIKKSDFWLKGLKDPLFILILLMDLCSLIYMIKCIISRFS